MKKVDFNVPYFDPTGKEVEGRTLATALTEIIATETEGKTLKLWGWVKDLQVGNPLHLDESDEKDLIKLIEENKRVMVFTKGQLLDVISSR